MPPVYGLPPCQSQPDRKRNRPDTTCPAETKIKVDSIRSYSNRSDLLEDLDRAVRQLSQALAEPSAKRTSVTSTGRVGRQWALQDRLSEEDVRGLVEAFNVGTPKWKLAKRYNISVSSVKRLLRLHRAAAWIVTHEV